MIIFLFINSNLKNFKERLIYYNIISTHVFTLQLRPLISFPAFSRDHLLHALSKYVLSVNVFCFRNIFLSIINNICHIDSAFTRLYFL
jgi:hypothetical protein